MILKNKYNRDDFLEFQKDFLPDFTKDVRPFPCRGLQISKDVVQIGYSEKLDLKVFEFSHESTTDPRVSLTRDGFRVMKDSGTYLALAAYHSDRSKDWRLSLMAANLEINEKGKVRQSFSDPRRYSFFLGPDAKTHTSEDFLIKQGGVQDVNDLIGRFDIEVVTKEFFTKYKQLFEDLQKFLLKDNDFMKFASQNNINTDAFAKKTLGQIVFCYFLQKKGWLGASRDGDINEGKSDFMRWFFNKSVKDNKNYYNDGLEYLFYDALNSAPENPGDFYRNQLGFQVPFLNGGLFEPFQGYDWAESFLQIPDTMFSNREKTGILDVFDLYNFTVHEDDPVDREVSVDPEMLGKVFENLLPENIRKGQGAYYTPREIVHYMCQESLINYLITKTDIDEKNIRILITLKDHLFTSEESFVFSSSESKSLDIALAGMQVCDPACGSGAFLVGMLHEIIMARRTLNPKKQEYRLKKDAIQNSLYGVDVDPGAVEIAKLRLWLSLVVDYELKDIEPLPNLEFKIVCANSLIPLAHEDQIMIWGDPELEDKIKNIRDRYFNTSSLRIKEKMKKDFEKLIAKSGSLFASEKQKQLVTYHPFNPNNVCGFFDSALMFGVDGFDVVIANPPYIQLQKDSGFLAKMYANYDFKTFVRTGDIYTLFYEHARQLICPEGIVCFITSNKWMRAGYGMQLRKFIIDETDPLLLIDFGDAPLFESATTYTNILLFGTKKRKNACEVYDFSREASCENSLLFRIESIKEKYRSRFSDTSFLIVNSGEGRLKEQVEAKGVPLKDWDINIYRGILTGCNEAFIVDTETKERMCEEDPNNENIFKPILRGRDVKRYRAEWAGLWLINMHNGYTLDSKGRVPRINVEEYPVIKKHLLQFDDRLAKRHDKGDTPYNLRNCAFLPELEKGKLVWAEIVFDSAFYYDDDKYFPEATSFVMTGEGLKYLQALLNSKLITFVFKRFYSGGDLRGNTFRYKKRFIEQIPIPIVSAAEQKKYEEIVNKILTNKKNGADTKLLENKIDELVFDLYELAPGERRIVLDNE
ncbi:MAG: Eco57I restriction-modification methylase domain-containing protein [Candidatus Aceula meridiana]|nr:Eco57I restriction-modification methylase domain-containing protein [Candidatus Aceula meridiana]